jgi:hypothetical protein
MSSFALRLQRVVTARRATLLVRRRFIRGHIAAGIRKDNDPVDLAGCYGISTRYLDRDSSGDVIRGGFGRSIHTLSSKGPPFDGRTIVGELRRRFTQVLLYDPQYRPLVPWRRNAPLNCHIPPIAASEFRHSPAFICDGTAQFRPADV